MIVLQILGLYLLASCAAAALSAWLFARLDPGGTHPRNWRGSRP